MKKSIILLVLGLISLSTISKSHPIISGTGNGDSGIILGVTYYSKDDNVYFKVQVHNSRSESSYFRLNCFLFDANHRDNNKMYFGSDDVFQVDANADIYKQVSVQKYQVMSLENPQAGFILEKENKSFIMQYDLGIDKGNL